MRQAITDPVDDAQTAPPAPAKPITPQTPSPTVPAPMTPPTPTPLPSPAPVDDPSAGAGAPIANQTAPAVAPAAPMTPPAQVNPAAPVPVDLPPIAPPSPGVAGPSGIPDNPASTALPVSQPQTPAIAPSGGWGSDQETDAQGRPLVGGGYIVGSDGQVQSTAGAASNSAQDRLNAAHGYVTRPDGSIGPPLDTGPTGPTSFGSSATSNGQPTWQSLNGGPITGPGGAPLAVGAGPDAQEAQAAGLPASSVAAPMQIGTGMPGAPLPNQSFVTPAPSVAPAAAIPPNSGLSAVGNALTGGAPQGISGVVPGGIESQIAAKLNPSGDPGGVQGMGLPDQPGTPSPTIAPALAPAGTSLPAPANSAQPSVAPSGNGVSTAPIDPNGGLLNSSILPDANAPDRTKLVQDQFNNYLSTALPDFQSKLRGTFQNNAAMGRLGSGQLATSVGDLDLAAQRDANQKFSDLTTQATTGTIADRQQALDNYNTERNYEAGQENQGYNRGVQGLTLEDALTNSEFGRALAQQNAGQANNPAQTQLLLSQIFGQQATGAGQALSGLVKNTASNNAINGATGPSAAPAGMDINSITAWLKAHGIAMPGSSTQAPPQTDPYPPDDGEYGVAP